MRKHVTFIIYMRASSGGWGKIQLDAFATGNPFRGQDYLKLV